MTSDWALVDVETSGLHARRDRVLSVAVATLDSAGGIEEEYSSLFNPGCDPGPTHVHGLTRQRLRGAPEFGAGLSEVTRLLAGRTLVAHNAAFDHGFLNAEAARLGQRLPTTHRLCTVTLARRLQLGVPNVRLATLAQYWGIRQLAAHDARDDVRTLQQVFARGRELADGLGLALPVVACDETARAYPDKVVRVDCPWQDPGRFQPAVGLVQGTKAVITGPTSLARLDLARKLTDAGLDVMNAISGRTGVVIANAGASASRKLERAADLGIPVISEAQVLDLATRIVPGRPKTGPEVVEIIEPPIPRPAARPVTNRPVTNRSGPWSGRRILVLGGAHLEATLMRSRIVQLGGIPAVNLTATVTDVLVLDGGDGDRRMPKIRARQLSILSALDVDTALHGEPARPAVTAAAPTPEPAASEPAASEPTTTAVVAAPVFLVPGEVIDLPAGGGLADLVVNVAWRADGAAIPVVDVVAFELGEDQQVLSDDEFIFYNAPTSPDGAVTLTVDGDCEQGVGINLAAIPADVSQVMVGAAIEEGTFGDLGALSISVDTTARTVATGVLDAATTERSMIIAEIYRRRGCWRLRMLGQGYDDDLAAFAVRYGVDVDE
ncbi:MAG: TerD family protein [Gordonia sp. (in: high G+C Gram-positive bacteria)]